MEPMKPLPGMKPMEPLRPREPMTPMPFLNPAVSGERPWWPAKLGTPEAAGGQNDLRYAYFRDEKRLAVERGDDVIVYDTADHLIHGIAQAQEAGASSLVFTSQHGTVALDALKVIDVVRAGG